MHDTASRWLFTEGSRNFSHGCIRLQNPLDFAEKVFNGRSGFSKDRVRQVIDAGQQAHYTFPEPVTLYVTYRTVTAGADGAPSSATTSTAATGGSCEKWASREAKLVLEREEPWKTYRS